MDGHAWKGTTMRIHVHHDLKTSQHEDYIEQAKLITR